MSSVASSDYKIGKDGRKYPAKRIKLGTKKKDNMNEAAYPGNIGIMELAKFHSSATPEQKEKFISLMKKKQQAKSEKEEKQMASQIWDHIQHSTNTKLHQMESIEDEHLLQSLADKDINASVKNGAVHVYERDSVEKAKRLVKRLGMKHKVVQSKIQEDNEETYTLENLQEALPTHEFNALVRGYLNHKRAAKKSGFKPLNFHQYAYISNKAKSMPISEKFIQERTLSDAEKKKREEVALAIEKEHPGIEMSKKMAIATSVAKKTVSEEIEIQQLINEIADKVDTIEMNVPLLMKLMEYAKEDAKNDEELHRIMEKIVAASKEGTLTMDTYKEIVSEEKQIVIPPSKPRNPNYRVLLSKKGGAHKDDKKAFKNGDFKHKSKQFD